MRIGLLSDIHGNFIALQAVLKDMERQAVDSIICLGDIATLGPQPKEVVETVKGLDCPCIMGNHESALLDMGNVSAHQIAPSLVPALEWCLTQLEPEDLDYFRSFKSTLEVSVEGSVNLLYFHGSPRSNIDQIQSTTPAGELERFFDPHQPDVFIGGHTHIPMLRHYDGKLIVNPGSVGSAFRSVFNPGTPPTVMPWAEYAVMEVGGGVISVDLRRIPFDVNEFNRIVSQSGIPIS